MNRRTFLSSLLATPLLYWLAPWVAHADPLPTGGVTRMAFGSCALENQAQPIWDVIAATKPDLFTFLGDNIYGDTEDMDVLAEKYRSLGAISEFARFRSKHPIIATWDDHDYGANDAGRDYPMKAESKKLMLDFFREPQDSPRRRRPGVYTSYVFGGAPKRLQIILLDLRWFQGEHGTELLGSAQWAWLEEQLKVDAEVRVLGSSIQFVSSEHGDEKWGSFPSEKRKLLALLDRLNVRNLVVISGDMHFGELSLEKTPGGIPIYDLTSSGLTHFLGVQENSKRLASFDEDCNFGLISVDWNAQPVKVALEVRDSGGVSRIRKQISVVR